MRRLFTALVASLALVALLAAPAAAQGPATTLCNAVTASGVCATTLTLNNAPAVTFQLFGGGAAFIATVRLQGTVDGARWVNLAAYPVSSTSDSTAPSGDAVFRSNTQGFVTVRANVTAYTSGTITVTAIPSSVQLPVVTP